MVVYVHCLPLSLCLSRSMCCILNNIIPSGCARMHDPARETKIVVLSFTFCVCLCVTMFPFLFLNLYTDVNHCITVYIHVQLFSRTLFLTKQSLSDALLVSKLTVLHIKSKRFKKIQQCRGNWGNKVLQYTATLTIML